jgi:hypothetical protein
MNKAGVAAKCLPQHTQTDGVTEQANRVVSSSVCSEPPVWRASQSAVLEIAYNDSVNASTGYTPFFFMFWYHPILPLSLYANPTFLPAETEENRCRIS